MLDEFTPIIIDLPCENSQIYCVADVHIGAKECDLDGFKAFCKRVESEPNSYIVLCGDILNNAVKDSLSNIYEERYTPQESKMLAYEILKPLADGGKILAAVMGNHEFRSAKMVDLEPMYDVAVMLGIQERYRRYMAFLRLRMRNGNIKDRWNFCIAHGASANKKRRFQIEGVDAFITGHTHAPAIEKPAHIAFTHGGKVAVKEVAHITATSWLNYGGYAAQKFYQPQSTGNPQRIILQAPKSNRNDNKNRIRVAW